MESDIDIIICNHKLKNINRGFLKWKKWVERIYYL